MSKETTCGRRRLRLLAALLLTALMLCLWPADRSAQAAMKNKTVKNVTQAAEVLSDIRTMNGHLIIKNYKSFTALYVKLLKTCKVGSYGSYYWGHLATNLRINIHAYGTKGAYLTWVSSMTPKTFGDEDYIRAQADKLIKKLNLRSGTAAQKAYRLWVWIQENITYGGSTVNGQTADSFFRYHKTVCAGAAAAYAYILNRVGVKCIPLPIEDAHHECCYVYVAGAWYIVDPTPETTPGTPNVAAVYARFLTTPDLYMVDMSSSPSFTTKTFQKAFPVAKRRYAMAKILRKYKNVDYEPGQIIFATDNSGKWYYASDRSQVDDDAIYSELLL